MTLEWRHKDEWKLGYNPRFSVVVSRHLVTSDPDKGPHRWAVYAYIYPDHAYFKEFDPDFNMFQSAATAMPLHWGPSLFKVHRDDKGEVCSYQVGADYNHVGDDDFTHMATDDDAWSVFVDAEALYGWLIADAKVIEEDGDQS